MLISKIISMAETQSDESYDAADWVDRYNLCQDDLTSVAKILTTTSGIAVTVTAKAASITIANDADLITSHRILNVYYTPTITGGAEVQLRRLKPADKYSKGWKMDKDNIYLQGLGAETAGTVKVDFYKKLAHCVYVASPESYTPTTPEIPEEYHGIYISYLCGKSQQGEYNAAKQLFALERIREMEPWTLKDYLQALQASQSSGGGS